jgi:hypothetical protein
LVLWWHAIPGLMGVNGVGTFHDLAKRRLRGATANHSGVFNTGAKFTGFPSPGGFGSAYCDGTASNSAVAGSNVESATGKSNILGGTTSSRPWAFGCWVNLDGVTGTQCVLALTENGVNGTVNLGIRQFSTGFRMETSGGAAMVSTSVHPTAGRWSFVAGGYDGSNSWIFADGEYATSASSVTLTPQVISAGRYTDFVTGSERWFDAMAGYVNDIWVIDRNVGRNELVARWKKSRAGYRDELNRLRACPGRTTVAAPATFAYPFLFKTKQRRKSQPRRRDAVRAVIIPTGTVTRIVPVSRVKPSAVVTRAKRVIARIPEAVAPVFVTRVKQRAVETRTKRTPVIMPATVTVSQPVAFGRTKQRVGESRRSRSYAPLPGNQMAPIALPAKQRRVVEFRFGRRTTVMPSEIRVATPLVLTRTKTRVPQTRGQKKLMIVEPLPRQLHITLPGKTRSRIESRGRRVLSQFPAPLRNVPILMPPRMRRTEVTRRQRKVVPLVIHAPGLPIAVQRVRTQPVVTRLQKRVVPLSLPARQTPVVLRRFSRGGTQTRRTRSIATVPVKVREPLPVVRKQIVRTKDEGRRTKLRAVPVAVKSAAIVLPAKKQRSIETRTVRRSARFPGTGAASGGLVVVQRKRTVERGQATGTRVKLRPLPVASLTASKPIVVPGRRRVQTIVVRRSAVRIVPVGAGSRNVVVHTTKKTW